MGNGRSTVVASKGRESMEADYRTGCLCGRAEKVELHGSTDGGGYSVTVSGAGCVADDGRTSG